MQREKLTLPPPPATDRPGDRWVCGRTGDQSPCSRGPSLKGVCPLADACRPQKTWHGRRHSIALVMAVVLVIAVFALTWSRNSASVFKPGDLSMPHAQILAGTLASDRCASCHPQAATSPRRWFSSANEAHKDVSLTDRCLNCHHTTLDRPTAKLAHNLPQRARAALRLASVSQENESWHDLLPGPAVDQENVECSACHREHRGTGGDLLAVSDAQCQTCHAKRFGSFATSHPEWDRWPYGRGRQISFDHASHANKHFPATAGGSSAAPFQCVDCHAPTADNELARTTSYERACKSCHDDALRIEAAEGVDLLALPTIPSASAATILPWPESATGFYDGTVSPLADLLIRSNPDAVFALRRLPDRDFSRIDARNPDEVAAAQAIAVAHRELLEEIAARGQHAIVERASTMGFTSSTLSPLVRSLPPQLIRDATERWFPSILRTRFDEISYPPSSILLGKQGQNHSAQPALHGDESTDEVGADDSLLKPLDPENDLVADPLSGDGADLLGTDLLGADDPRATDSLRSDPLANDRLQDEGPASGSQVRFDADKMMPAGGWYRDDLRLAIRYRGGGHDDPVLKSTIELISQLPLGDPTRERLLRTRAVSACVACHTGAVLSASGWRSASLIGLKSELTKFSHGPHLNVAQLADCSHCHTIVSPSSSNVNLASGIGVVRDFQPLGREACGACHTPQAAGDACVKCHRYHIDLR